jgi:hypothetical protein
LPDVTPIATSGVQYALITLDLKEIRLDRYHGRIRRK